MHPYISRVSCEKGPTRHAYAWQIGLFWQDTLDLCVEYLSVSPYSVLRGRSLSSIASISLLFINFSGEITDNRHMVRLFHSWRFLLISAMVQVNDWQVHQTLNVVLADAIIWDHHSARLVMTHGQGWLGKLQSNRPMFLHRRWPHNCLPHRCEHVCKTNAAVSDKYQYSVLSNFIDIISTLMYHIFRAYPCDTQFSAIVDI